MVEKPTYEELKNQVLGLKKAELKHKRTESLMERAIAIGVNFSIESGIGRGTKVIVERGKSLNN